MPVSPFSSCHHTLLAALITDKLLSGPKASQALYATHVTSKLMACRLRGTKLMRIEPFAYRFARYTIGRSNRSNRHRPVPAVVFGETK